MVYQGERERGREGGREGEEGRERERETEREGERERESSATCGYLDYLSVNQVKLSKYGDWRQLN